MFKRCNSWQNLQPYVPIRMTVQRKIFKTITLLTRHLWAYYICPGGVPCTAFWVLSLLPQCNALKKCLKKVPLHKLGFLPCSLAAAANSKWLTYFCISLCICYCFSHLRVLLNRWILYTNESYHKYLIRKFDHISSCSHSKW